MLKILIPLFIFFSSSTYAFEYAGQYVAKVRPSSCTFGRICHENEYKKVLVLLERRKIKLVNFDTNRYDVYAIFDDLTKTGRYKQKACPSIIKNLGRTYYVTYDPFKNTYMIDCNNFK